MTFLYFVEQDSESKPTENELAALGLSYIVDRYSELVHGGTLNDGPGGKRGVVLARKAEGVQPRYYPANQEWRKIAGRWIGWNKSIDVSSLKPEQFERDSLLDGHTWTDWKGNKWKIPVARKYDLDSARSFANLPTYLGMDESGDWVVKGIQTKYKQLWELACLNEDRRLEAAKKARDEGLESFSYQISDLTDVCNIVFGANYRLSSIELSIMEVLTNEAASRVLRLLNDEPGLEQLLKKTQHVTANT